MHIVFAAPECVPYVKTGGVADVAAALPREVVRQGHQVTVYLPLYRQTQKFPKEKKVVIPSLTIPFPSYNRFVRVVDGGKPDGVQFYFIDCPELFDREYLYGRRVESTPITRSASGSSPAPSSRPASNWVRPIFSTCTAGRQRHCRFSCARSTTSILFSRTQPAC